MSHDRDQAHMAYLNDVIGRNDPGHVPTYRDVPAPYHAKCLWCGKCWITATEYTRDDSPCERQP